MNVSDNLVDLFRNFSIDILLQIVLIGSVSWLLITLFSKWVPILANTISGRFRFRLLALVPIFRLGVFIAALLLILNRVIEPQIENIIALISLLGLGLGFAFKDYVSSLIAGVVTLYETPYRPGDWIEVEGAYGEVRAINLRSVEIVTPDSTVVIIPHLKIWNQLLFNANDGRRQLLCVADFYLHPDHNGREVQDILYDVASTSAYLQSDQPIRVVVHEQLWGTHYRLKAYPIDPRQQFEFITDLTIRSKEILAEKGIRFASAPAISQENNLSSKTA